MPVTIPSLWPEDIKVDVLPPLAILKLQAAKIHEITKGILHGEVTTVTGSDDFVSHRLDLSDLPLDARRQRLLTATHRTDFYPVMVEAETFRPKSRLPVGVFANPLATWPDRKDWRPVANDQDEFLKCVGQALKSPEVRAVLDSLIALSNEKSQPVEGTAPAA